MSSRSPRDSSSLSGWLAAYPMAATVALNLAVTAGCWGLGELALLRPDGDGRAIPLWPPAGLGVALAWTFGLRVLPGIYLGVALAVGSRVGAPIAAISAIGSVLEVLIDVRLMRLWAFDARLERTRDVLILALGVAPIGALGAAIFGTLGVALLGGFTPAQLPSVSAIWWLRNWLGVLVVAALVFSWTRSQVLAWTWRRTAEAAALAVILALASQLVFGLWGYFGGRDLPVAFLSFPLLGWAGLRFGPRGASIVVAYMSFFAALIAALGVGPFAAFPVGVTHVVLFLFLASGSVFGQSLAAIIGERDEALRRHVAVEDQLRHSQKMEAMGRLAGGIAHDFNNLLTAIIGYTEIVLTSLDPKDPRRADAEEIGRAAMRAADLTRQMLAFSRKEVLQPKIIDLNIALTKVEPMLRRVLGEHIQMTVAGKATNALVRVDPGQFEQVVMNLVVNARDAMPQGGRLTVDTADTVVDRGGLPDNPAASPGQYIQLSVQDTGVGMSADTRARIFEPYFTTKEMGKGTGLGLSTVYGIVRQSDGYITVASEPGLGTTIRVYLPRAEAEAVTTTDREGDRLPGGTEHILLVEDDPSVRRMAKELLTRLGYSVTEAASGRAGLALGSDDTRHFDLVLCDVILGDMSGPAVVEGLAALRPALKVLFMSGYTDEAIVRTGVLDEGKPFLQKPFTPAQLARSVRELLEERSE